MIGHHCSKNGRKMGVALEEEYRRAIENGVTPGSMQIFVMGPRSMKESLSDDEKRAVIAFANNRDVAIVVHSAYINHPWASNRGRGGVLRELKICHDINATGLVVHLSSHVAKNDYAAFIETINYLATKMDPEVKETQTLWLEINAAKPSEWTFERPEAIAKLLSVLDENNNNNIKVGICVDTAHLGACGVALRSAMQMERWFIDAGLITIDDSAHNKKRKGYMIVKNTVFTRRYKLKVPIMIHLNDLKPPIGVGKDIHECLGQGTVWTNKRLGSSSLKWLMRLVHDHNIVTILERNIEHVHNDYQVLRPIIELALRD